MTAKSSLSMITFLQCGIFLLASSLATSALPGRPHGSTIISSSFIPMHRTIQSPFRPRRHRHALSMVSSITMKPPQLNQNTVWLLSLSLTKEGYDPIDGEIRLRFVQEANYEPPQGRIFIEKDSLGLIQTNDKGFAVGQGVAWTLSEDKEDRKFGLWIWGLFEEPLYPYLYFSLGVYNNVMLKGNEGTQSIFGGKGVPNQKLYFRFNHVREDGASVLSEGKLTYKEIEMMKADPLGLGGMVAVGDERPAGEAQLKPYVT